MTRNKIYSSGFHTPNLLGFDELFNELTNAKQAPSYPPYNVIRVDDDNFVIELAVAGFAKKDLDLELHNGKLTVKGNRDSDERDYLTRGLSFRNFAQEFRLHEHIQVESVDLENGLLTVKLRKEVPEELRPKKLEIT